MTARPEPHAATTTAQRWAAWEAHQKLVAQSPFNGLKWRDIGPVVQGGRVVDIASVPGAPYTFYVAYASGGVWKTTNNGVSFEPLSDRLPTMVTGAIAVDPQKTDTLWVGSGEPNSSRSSYGGLGVFRSDDGGKSFRPMGLDDTDRISRILVHPGDSDTVYVAAIGKLYTEGGSRGIFRTRDGGKTWQHVLKGESPWTGAIDLAMDPRDPNVLYAAQWERERKPWKFVESGKGSGIYKSTDGGETWTRLAGGFPTGAKVGRIGLSIAASQPDTLYASVDNWDELPADQQEKSDRSLSAASLRTMSKEEFLRQDPEEIETFIRNNDLDTALDATALIDKVRKDEVTLADLVRKLDASSTGFDADKIRGLEIYRSDDAGKTWRRTNQHPLREVNYSYGYYFGVVRVSPTDPEHVYAQGLPMIESTDGGKTWHGLNDPQVHVDYHELLIDPNYPQRLIAGNDGGVDMSYDGGKTWIKLDAQPVGQLYTINVDMADPYNVCGGFQDNGTLKGSSRTKWRQHEDWSEVGGGDGMWCAFDLRDGQTFYSGYQFGNYSRSGGPGGAQEVRARAALKDPPLRYNWLSPLVLSTHNPDVVYLAANRLFRSFDEGETWSAISPDLTTSKQRGNVPFATISTVSESPRQFGLIWAGTDDGNVWVTDTAGTHWKNVADTLPADRWVSRVEASHHETRRAYVSLNGYRNDDGTPYLYRTDDLGQRWTSIGKGLPDEPINVVREDPVNADVLYVGTDRGVYVSRDRGNSWESLQANLPNVPVHDLIVHPRERELVAATHGRSAWVVDVLPVQELTPVLAKEALKLFPLESVQGSRDWRSRPSEWFDEKPYLPQIEGAYWVKSAGTVTLSVVDSNGNPVQKLTFEAGAGVNAWQWDLSIDKDLALKAEQAALAKDAGTEKDGKPNLSKTPVAESVRLGHRLLATPGKYTVRLEQGSASSETALEIKAPEARKPRAKAPPSCAARTNGHVLNRRQAPIRWPRNASASPPANKAVQAGAAQGSAGRCSARFAPAQHFVGDLAAQGQAVFVVVPEMDATVQP
ncbi:WD40/YVTN/BNR-like repeat-containing protein [Tahibacter amnicola]|uniref:Sortilin N-terminal domain-containing protein n=1 Tax=Tahibacter amnicola TaxID=2976241 RepID=A0ABY6BHV0_9GAMM|nr:sialidase family protein [Tahibacter amnicola]UXI68186.1 hypothetical protein N4264_00595 [Tahibacter amnicola]